MDYILTAVNSTNFTGTDGAMVEATVTWLDPFPSSAGNYYAFVSNTCKLEFTQDGNRGLADLTGTYSNDQYVFATLGNLASSGSNTAWVALNLHCQGTRANPPTATSHYRVRISQYTGDSLPSTKIQKVTSGTTVTDLASNTTTTWASGDKCLFVIIGGVLEVYRDSGSGWGASPILTYDDSASPLTGGVPGFHINRADTYTFDDLEMGDAELDIDLTAPVLSSATGAGGAEVCSGTVDTDTAEGTLYAVVTDSATPPTAAQVKAGQDHTGTTAKRIVSQSVTVSGTQTIASGSLTGGAGTRYFHYMHEDVALNQSTVATTTGFTITLAPVSITGVTATSTTAVVSYTGGPTHYRLNAGTAIVIGASPYTITGLTPNTEYTLEIGDGSTWEDSLDFGTENPVNMGSGGSSTQLGVQMDIGIKIGI